MNFIEKIIEYNYSSMCFYFLRRTLNTCPTSLFLYTGGIRTTRVHAYTSTF